MKKYFCFKLIVSLACSVLIFIAAGPVWGQQCIDIFRPADATQASRRAWAEIINPINELLNENISRPPVGRDVDQSLLGQVSYSERRDLDHVIALERILARSSRPFDSLTTVERVFSFYRSAMRSEENPLMPKFIFQLRNGELIGLEPGERIPEGATFLNRGLTQVEFDTVVARGYFPMGGHRIGEGISMFEHDLAHLTAFLDSPSYMHFTRQLSVRAVERGKRKDQWDYYLNEGLTVVREEVRPRLNQFLKWPEELFQKSEVRFNEVESFLSTLSQNELRSRSELVASQYMSIIKILGGAGRDPSQPNYVLHNPTKRMINDLTDGLNRTQTVDIKMLATIELFLFNLKDIQISDWFVEREDGNTPARQRLRRLILNGSRVISEEGHLDGDGLPHLAEEYWRRFGSW